MKKITSIILFSIMLISITASAQTEKYKALFIYNFTKHIDWPAADKNGDFVICIVDQKSLYENLVAITAGKKVGNQNIVLKSVDAIDGITDCHILILGTNNSTPKRLAELTALKKTTLIVASGGGSATKGATINFIVEEGKLKFELNKTEVANHDLKVSSYLENIAIIVG